MIVVVVMVIVIVIAIVMEPVLQQRHGLVQRLAEALAWEDSEDAVLKDTILLRGPNSKKLKQKSSSTEDFSKNLKMVRILEVPDCRRGARAPGPRGASGRRPSMGCPGAPWAALLV